MKLSIVVYVRSFTVLLYYCSLVYYSLKFPNEDKFQVLILFIIIWNIMIQI